MIRIDGLLYDGQSSRQLAAQLHFNTVNQLDIESEQGDFKVELNDLKISPRLGNTPRFIELPEGRRFETQDNNAVDLIEAQIPASSNNRFVHRLESHLKYVVFTLIFVVIFSWGFIQFGIPALSKTIAFSLPSSISQSIASGALELLDKWAFTESELPEQRRSELTEKMLKVLPENSGYDFDLVFRKGNEFGANAFALPDGTIVFTDEIINLSQHDDELVTVMAHEVGHVIHRHNLRNLIQDSGLAVVLLTVTGDVSTSSSLLLALPTLMVEASYSKSFELEADNYALEYIKQHNIDGSHFTNLMTRLETVHDDEASDTSQETQDGNQILDYFSSHPPTADRVKRFASPKEKIQ